MVIGECEHCGECCRGYQGPWGPPMDGYCQKWDHKAKRCTIYGDDERPQVCGDWPPSKLVLLATPRCSLKWKDDGNDNSNDSGSR